MDSGTRLRLKVLQVDPLTFMAVDSMAVMLELYFCRHSVVFFLPDFPTQAGFILQFF